jgi:hypothetical protein
MLCVQQLAPSFVRRSPTHTADPVAAIDPQAARHLVTDASVKAVIDGTRAAVFDLSVAVLSDSVPGEPATVIQVSVYTHGVFRLARLYRVNPTPTGSRCR